jgi:hypothetical protein
MNPIRNLNLLFFRSITIELSMLISSDNFGLCLRSTSFYINLKIYNMFREHNFEVDVDRLNEILVEIA